MEYISREAVNDLIEDIRNNHFILMSDRVTLLLLKSKVAEIPTADVQSVYCAENVQTEVLNYLFNKEREAESMSYGDKRQERIVTIREIIRFVEDIDPRMDGDTNG